MSEIEVASSSDDIVDVAEKHHREGRLQEAEALYRKALEIDPGHPGALFYLAHIACDDGRLPFATELTEELLRSDNNDAEAWHLLGTIALKEENLTKAGECFKKAIAIQPAYLQAHYHLGTVLTKERDYEAALSSFRQAMALNPKFAEVHCAIGSILKIQNKLDEALASFRKTLDIKIDFELAYTSIGEILLSQEKVDEAIANFQKAIDNNVDTALIHAGLGTGYLAKNQYTAAVTSFERAIALDPRCFLAQFNLGNALFKLGKIKEAANSFRHALALNSQDARLLENLATALYSLGEIDNAVEIYQQWLVQEPNNPIARHHLAACMGEQTPVRAEDAYVEHTFDTFAETFDTTLAGINYRGPELLAEALQRHCGVASKQFYILDAGCGTGLCGPLVKQYASALVGVDLSAGMLAKAKLRNVYDDLIKAELTEFLQTQHNIYDVVLSADTLIYFGAVEDLFAATRKAMRSNGYLFLTAEALFGDDESLTYRLNPHGRYSHSEAYLRRTLTDAGFTLVNLETTTLRYENGAAVQGFILSCCTSAVPAMTSDEIEVANKSASAKFAINTDNDAETWHSLGVSALNEGDLIKAANCFEKAIEIDLTHASSHYHLAVALGQQGDENKAFASLQRAIQHNPEFIDAHCAIGSIFKVQNRNQEALLHFRQVANIKPDFEWVYAVIGEIFLSEKRSDEAIENFRKAIDNNIDSAQIYSGLGTAYYSKKEYGEAITSFRRALTLEPQNYNALSNLGYIFLVGGKYTEAEALLRQALALNSHDVCLLERFADTLYKLGKIDNAAEIYSQWIALEPNNPVARHHLAGCLGKNVPTRADNAYVEHTFDDFAVNFDEVLGKLNYRGPQLLAEALARQCTPKKQYAILDAGCGTGLSGPLVTQYAARLTGVDLSSGMLEKAKSKNVYDELEKSELTAYVQSKRNVFDIVLLADTLIYFGAVENLFAGTRGAMGEGGYFFLTAESLPDNLNGKDLTYHLNPHGRYSHSEAYLRRALSDAGFTVMAVENVVLRMELNQPVSGFVLTCRAVASRVTEKFSISASYSFNK